jgi:hypothetical protein
LPFLAANPSHEPQEKTEEAIKNLEGRVTGLSDQDYNRATEILREAMLVARRGFDENSPHLRGCRAVQAIFWWGKFRKNDRRPWDRGISKLRAVLDSMHAEVAWLPTIEVPVIPDNLTIPWLAKNLSWKVWLSLICALLTAFTLGVTLGQTTFVKELLKISGPK